MSVVALIISVIALIFAYRAYRLSGGTTDELTSKVEDLGNLTENLREKSADALNRLEKMIRGQERAASPAEDNAAEETIDAETVTDETAGSRDESPSKNP